MRINLVQIADDFYHKLKKSGIYFSENGFPLFTKEMLLDKTPSDIVPYKNMNSLKEKNTVVVCFFQEDERLYSRLCSVDRDIPKFREFMGVCGLDLSPNIFWPIEQQLFNILLGQLYSAYLAINGIKIVPNWRIGDLSTLKALKSYPQDSQFVVGTLGSIRKDKSLGTLYMKAKIYVSNPSRLLIYGKLASEYSVELDEMGIQHIQYNDIMTKRDSLRRRSVQYGC